MNGDVLLSDTNFYAVRQNTPIFFEARIGDGQIGGTALRLNGTSIPVHPNGRTRIGKDGEDLRHSVLQCLTTVKDVNESTNNTSIEHELTGGISDEVFPYAIQVKKDKGIARYFITYVLA